MLALCFMLLDPYYAQNYTGIIAGPTQVYGCVPEGVPKVHQLGVRPICQHNFRNRMLKES